MSVSKTLQTMLEEGVGYRNHTLYSGRDYLFEDVLEEEIEELENDDILDYCKEAYGWEDVESIIRGVRELLGTQDEKLYAWWLTSREGVIRNYNEDNLTISEYDLQKGDTCVISDLEDAGVLFVSRLSLTDIRRDNK